MLEVHLFENKYKNIGNIKRNKKLLFITKKNILQFRESAFGVTHGLTV